MLDVRRGIAHAASSFHPIVGRSGHAGDSAVAPWGQEPATRFPKTSFARPGGPIQLDRIVVGIDFSEPSIAAAHWTARYLARGAELILVYSIAIPEPPNFLSGRFPARDAIIETARTGAATRLRRLAASIGAERVRWEIPVDDAARRIEQIATEVDADLIVIGKHGARSGLWRRLGSTAERVEADLIVVGSRQPGRIRRALLGSVASETLHRSTRSVLVVKEPAVGASPTARHPTARQ